MIYSCDICKYSSNDKFNYNKHLNTKKHIEKMTASTITSPIIHDNIIDVSSENEYKCSFCNNKYTKQNIARHRISCNVKQNMIEQYEKELTELKEKNAIISKEIIYKEKEIIYKDDIITKEICHRDDVIKTKDEVILILTHENKNLKVLLSGAGTLVEKSMSALSYITKNYGDAPALEPIKNIPALHYDLSEEQVVETIIMRYRTNKLISFIGDIIIKKYKTEDPAKQSLWNSDTDRLTYVMRTLLSNKKGHWKIDKKGIDVAQYIVNPILDYIREKLDDFLDTSEKLKRTDKTDKIMETMNKLQDAHEVIQIIKSNELTEDILRYVAPHMYLIKEPTPLL